MLSNAFDKSKSTTSVTFFASIASRCSCVIFMDFNVCHKQIEEKWRQQTDREAEHEFSNIEVIDLENIKNSQFGKKEEHYVLDILNFVTARTTRFCR